MQIFLLDENVQKCAEAHANKHCIKQILESCQLLCTTMRMHDIDYGYRITHKKHPCRLWLEESKENFYWLKSLGLELCNEYTFRYGKVHKTQKVLEGCQCPEDIPDIGLTPFAQAMPDQYKNINTVKAYRDYYIGEKKDLLCYTKRQPPEWLEGIAQWKK